MDDSKFPENSTSDTIPVRERNAFTGRCRNCLDDSSVPLHDFVTCPFKRYDKNSWWEGHQPIKVKGFGPTVADVRAAAVAPAAATGGSDVLLDEEPDVLPPPPSMSPPVSQARPATAGNNAAVLALLFSQAPFSLPVLGPAPCLPFKSRDNCLSVYSNCSDGDGPCPCWSRCRPLCSDCVYCMWSCSTPDVLCSHARVALMSPSPAHDSRLCLHACCRYDAHGWGPLPWPS